MDLKMRFWFTEITDSQSGSFVPAVEIVGKCTDCKTIYFTNNLSVGTKMTLHL